jgi:hypothetical protein
MDREIRQVCAELELLSHGKTVSYNSSGRGESDAVVPQGEASPPHLEYKARWTDAPDDHHRQRVLDEARQYLRAWKKREEPAEGDGSTEDDWIVRDGEGYEAEQVARKFNTTVSRVRKLRMADDRDTEFGLPTRFAPRQAATPERIQNLADQGCTERQIAFQAGVSKTTVRRALGKAA